jgi:prevent-host-death family protein
MSEIQVSMTELRQDLGRLVNRAAYGGDRIVLVSHGEPKAAIVGVADLERLKRVCDEMTAERDYYARALATATTVREKVRRWQEEHSIEPEDSVETLRRLREERDDELVGLR